MRISSRQKLNAVAGLTVLSGLVTLSSTLSAIARYHHIRIVVADAHLTVISGLSLVYLAALLRRGKHNAWLVSLPVYVYLTIRNYRHFFIDIHRDDRLVPAVLNLTLPIIALGMLIIFRKLFNVRSEILSFALAIRRSVIILAIAFLYGLVGFSVMDESDFHQEISLVTSAHYVVDQFGLTTSYQLHPYTKRANFLLGSLAAVSLTAVAYSGLAFFAPVRFKLRNRHQDYQDLNLILKKYSTTSEDFFKMWPHDKAYYFNRSRTACIAYHTAGGVALAAGDPVGPRSQIYPLIRDFIEFCRANDWAPAFIHTAEHNLDAYVQEGLEYQKIGEEAIVNIPNFVDHVAGNKYFRHISNKFTKLGYEYKHLMPPHSQETIFSLREISEEWLKLPAKEERRFMMGYFSEDYIKQCAVGAAFDSGGRLVAFINQVPSPVESEANFDFLRHRLNSPGNINDYVMLNFINFLNTQSLKKLNMGLAPLSGLEKINPSQRNLINSFLNFAYANGSRFYSFQGLARFKSKYEPDWQSRYIVYSGGLLGFSKTINGLIRAMRISKHHF